MKKQHTVYPQYKLSDTQAFLRSCVPAFLLLFLWLPQVRGQSPIPNAMPIDSTHIGHCGTSGKSIWQRELAYRNFLQTGVMLDEGGNPQAFTALPQFPANLAVPCGNRFMVYYEDDVVAANGGGFGGFADSFWGSTRKNTLCEVLHYIEERLDFSAMPVGQRVAIYVDQSYSTLNLAPITTSDIATSTPTLTGVNGGSSGYSGGDAFNYITTGIDPDV
ncbi:MAG: hypothetical protein ACKVTZ_24070, partial [Bacteroidia bacterium]